MSEVEDRIWDRKFCLLLVLLLFCYVLLAFYAARDRRFDHDEFDVIHSAWYLTQGQVPYRDFFQHHHLLGYVSLMPILWLFGETVTTVLVVRMFGFLLLLAMLLVCYRLARRVVNPRVALIAPLYLLTMLMFVDKVIEYRPDVPLALFSLLAIGHFVRFTQTRQSLYLVLCGFELGVAYLFSMKALLSLVLLLALFLYEVVRRRQQLVSVGVFLGMFFLTISPFYVYLYLTGILAEYFFFNWTLNLLFLDRVSPVIGLGYYFHRNNLHFLLYFFSVWLCFRGPREQRMLALLSLGLFLGVLPAKHPWSQYYLPALPLMAIVASSGFYQLAKNRTLQLLLLALLLSATFLLFRSAFMDSNRVQLARITFVINNTTPADYVYDGDAQFNLFRKDLDYFWYSLREDHALETYQTLRPYQYDIYGLIARYQPRIISSFQLDRTHPLFIHYRYLPQVDLFIRQEKQVEPGHG